MANTDHHKAVRRNRTPNNAPVKRFVSLSKEHIAYVQSEAKRKKCTFDEVLNGLIAQDAGLESP